MMETYVALLRGINVGGRNSLPMKELVSLLERLGCKGVKTYIQSGNAVFKTLGRNAVDLSERISKGINESRGFYPKATLISYAEFDRIIKVNPFPEAVADPKRLHLGFLETVPMTPDLSRLEALKGKSERFELIGSVFYLFAPDGIGRSKLAAGSEKALGVSMTDRNWRTVCKIRDMAEAMEK